MLEPRVEGVGDIFVAALVNDFLRRRAHTADASALRRFDVDNPRTERNRLALVAISVWLLGDEWFATPPIPFDLWWHLLDIALADLAQTAAAHRFVAEADRREELARVTLARLGFRPQDETQAQATDRLSAVSSVERKRLLTESQAAHERTRLVREALVRKAAQESADKWTRE